MEFQVNLRHGFWRLNTYYYRFNFFENNMAKITFNFELSRSVSKNGLSHILLRIQDENQNKKRINRGIDVSPKHWSTTRQRVRNADPDYVNKNAQLTKLLSEAETVKQNLEEVGEEITAERIASALLNAEQPLSFIQFAEEYADRYFQLGEIRQYRKFNTFLTKFKFFLNGIGYSSYLKYVKMDKTKSQKYEKKHFTKDITFKGVTHSVIEKFHVYLKSMPNSLKVSQVLAVESVGKHMKVFRSCFHAGLEEKNIVLPMDPFYGLKLKRSEAEKDRLTMDEILKLQNLDLEPGSLNMVTRDCFLFSFYCAGIRCGDVISMRGSNLYMEDGVWRLKYQMGKTKKVKDIKLHSEVLSILSRYVDFDNLSDNYIFPLLSNSAPYAKAVTLQAMEKLQPEAKAQFKIDITSKNALLNKYLQKLSKMASLTKHVSMHVARHSFANVARTAGVNVMDVCSALGHSSLQITEVYLSKFNKETQDQMMDEVFNSRFHQLQAVFKRYTLPEINESLATLGFKVVPI